MWLTINNNTKTDIWIKFLLSIIILFGYFNTSYGKLLVLICVELTSPHIILSVKVTTIQF